MSKTSTYVIVAVAAFLIGGVTFRLVGSTGNGTAAKPADCTACSKADQRTFAIEGMSCQGCVDTITAALKDIPGVRAAKVSLADKKALVTAPMSEVPTDKIVAAIEAAGYKGKPVTADGDAAKQPAPDAKQPVLINITRGKEELHAVSMALAFAQAAAKDGRRVAVFLNVKAPVFATKDLDPALQFSGFPPLKKMIADFIAQGGKVLVCGHCSHVLGIDPKNFIDGAKVAGPGDVFAETPAGTVVFSW